MMGVRCLLCAVVIATGPILPVLADSNATSLAAELQSWRDACSDPNPDLVIGYLADAMATENIDVRKACVRQVLVSDNVDVQNAALRVIIANLPVIRFRLGELVKGRAGGRADEIITSLQHGLIFHGSDGNASSGTAQWMPLVRNATPVEGTIGTVTVFGSSIQWAGKCYYDDRNLFDCQLSADLVEGGTLTGTFTLWDMQFPASASLFD